MSFQRRLIVVVVLALSLGCATRKSTATDRGVQTGGERWTFEAAKQVLETAAVGESPLLRASSIAALAAGESGDGWVKRGWYDPSRTVQRHIAEQHPKRLTEADLERAGGDALARAIAVLGRQDHSISVADVSQFAAQDVLLPAILGDAHAMSTLLMDVRDGMVPPEPMFIEALIRSNIPGMGAAMAEGAVQAEEEMRLPLALAAQRVSPEDGQRALVEVLRDADEATKIFAVEAFTEREFDGATTWLKRAAKGEPGAVRQHARMGLVALGLLPTDEAVNALQSPDRDLRAWAARCLGMLSDKRPLPRSVIAAIETTWRDESMLVRLAATEALIASSQMDVIPLSPLQAKADVDAVSVMIAKKWFSIHHQIEPVAE